MQTTTYAHVLAGLKKVAAIDTYLTAHADEAVLQTKTAQAQQLFTFVKEAGIRELAAKALKHPVGRGAAYGLGAAIPATAAGSLLINQAGNESRDTIADARNKAIQTALALGGIGAGLYGLHRLTTPTQQESVSYTTNPETGEMVPAAFTMSKQSSDNNVAPLLEKIATVGFLDTMLEAQEKNANEDIRRDAHECRMLNAEHGIDLLAQLLNG